MGSTLSASQNAGISRQAADTASIVSHRRIGQGAQPANLRRAYRIGWLWLAAALFVTGCSGTGATPPPPPSLTAAPTALSAPDFVASQPEQALPALIDAERQAAHDRDLALLSLLWAEDGRVIDRRGTSQPADDYIWPTRAALLDRYTLAVFPNPPPVEPVTPERLTVDGDTAYLHAGVDDWTFAHRDGRWWILELAYN